MPSLRKKIRKAAKDVVEGVAKTALTETVGTARAIVTPPKKDQSVAASIGQAARIAFSVPGAGKAGKAVNVVVSSLKKEAAEDVARTAVNPIVKTGKSSVISQSRKQAFRNLIQSRETAARVGPSVALVPVRKAKTSVKEQMRMAGIQMATNPASRGWIQNYVLARAGGEHGQSESARPAEVKKRVRALKQKLGLGGGRDNP